MGLDDIQFLVVCLLSVGAPYHIHLVFEELMDPVGVPLDVRVDKQQVIKLVLYGQCYQVIPGSLNQGIKTEENGGYFNPPGFQVLDGIDERGDIVG